MSGHNLLKTFFGELLEVIYSLPSLHGWGFLNRGGYKMG